MPKQGKRAQATTTTTTTIGLQPTSGTLQKAQQQVLDELQAYRPDATLLPANPSVASLTFAQTFAHYLTGNCALSAAQEAWDGYTAEVAAKPLGPLEYRRPAGAPEALKTYARSLPGETVSLDLFTRRVLDLCLLVGYLVNQFLQECETQGPVAAVYAYLCERGLDEKTALGLLLHDQSVSRLRLVADPVPSASEPNTLPRPPQANALGRFLLTLLPDRLDDVTQLLGRPRVPDLFQHNLPTLVTFLGTFPEDRRYLPLAWQVARRAPPLLRGACASILLGMDPAGFDTDFQTQTGLTWGTYDARLAACRVLLDAERDVLDDLLAMRQLLWEPRRWSGTNPMNVAIPAWLEQSSPLIWWAPLLSAVADARVFPLLGKGPRVNFWRELGKLARRRTMLIEVEPGIRWYLTRDTFLRAYRRHTGSAFMQAGMCLDVSASALRDALMIRLGFDEHGKRTLRYGGPGNRQFSVQVGTDGSIQLADMRGNTLQTLPAATPRDDPEQVAQARQTLKTLKQQIPLVLAAGAENLRQAYQQRRSWQVAQWRASYLNHPLLRLLATRVIWQMMGSGDRSMVFRPREDGRLIRASGALVDVPEEGEIALLQADTLDQAGRAAWQGHLHKHVVLPLMDQLSVLPD